MFIQNTMFHVILQSKHVIYAYYNCG